MQRIEQIEDMPAAAWTALSVSDNDILTDKISRVKVGSADKGMGFRKRRPTTLQTIRDHQ
jgi:hypothetical protein